ncbi:MAG: hypothetical protein K8E66_09050, partial [Phycisphaerales bacterium]|nr:hypothetical protein [Phycisphaerales bacterium]
PGTARAMSNRSARYKSGSLSLAGAVAPGNGVMIGGGIFALMGQVAGLAGGLFPIAFVVAATNSSRPGTTRSRRPRGRPLADTFTVGVAIIATVSGALASIFAVSRMLPMLTETKLIPHSHFGMPGDVQKHTLVYTVVIAAVLAAVFDLSRIASIGAIFYLLMDITVHWGVLRHLHEDVGANRAVLGVAIGLDAIALGAFLIVKGTSGPLIVGVSLVSIMVVIAFERFYLRGTRARRE